MFENDSPGTKKEDILVGMWFAVALIEIAVVISGHFGIGFILPLVLATFLTLAILRPQISPMVAPEAEKNKRGSTDAMSALMELMDEDERQEFKYQLKQQLLDNVSRGSVDGELPLDSESLESLLTEDYDEKVLRS
jgi:hypothetical protein